MDKVKEHFSRVADNWNEKVWARDDTFAKDIIDFMKLRGNESLLYIGIGTGELIEKFTVSEIIGLDICKEMMKECKTIDRTHLIEGNANNIPFLDNAFDCVFSRNLLKHVENPIKVIAEAERVLKPEGNFFAIESCVLVEEDKEIPNYCVRTVEPNHFSFQTYDEIIDFFEINNLKVESEVYKYKSKWLDKWIKSSKANDDVKRKILEKYKNASEGFKKRQEVKIIDNDIESVIYWSFVKGVK